MIFNKRAPDYRHVLNEYLTKKTQPFVSCPNIKNKEDAELHPYRHVYHQSDNNSNNMMHSITLMMIRGCWKYLIRKAHYPDRLLKK